MNTQVQPPVETRNEQTMQTTQTTQNAQALTHHGPDRRLIAGVVLIAFGVLTLLGTLTDSSIVAMSILPALGVLFIVWGLVARLPGVMIPGGILIGLGTGTLLSQLAFSSMSGEAEGGIIVLGLGLGFLLILPLTWLISPIRHWWALIPGGILTFVGIALLAGGPALDALNVIGRLWPVIPIAVGIFLIWQLLRKR